MRMKSLPCSAFPSWLYSFPYHMETMPLHTSLSPGASLAAASKSSSGLVKVGDRKM